MRTPLAIRILRWSFCIVVTATIISGLFVVGSPAERRRESFDQERVNDLNSISYAIDTYYQTSSSTLPVTLESLTRSQPYLSTQLTDPSTNAPYEYRPLPGQSGVYELCATFETESNLSGNGPKSDPYQLNWTHSVGRTCFTQRIRIPGQLPV